MLMLVLPANLREMCLTSRVEACHEPTDIEARVPTFFGIHSIHKASMAGSAELGLACFASGRSAQHVKQ